MLEIGRCGAVARVTLSRPPMNAIDDEWVARFNAILDEIARKKDCCVLLIRSNAKGFCAGFDLKLAVSRLGTPEGAAAMARSTQNLRDLYARIEALPQMTIAEIAAAAVRRS